MTATRIMGGFPPPPEHQVTIENWRSAPFSSWAFRNIRQLLPTAPIYRGDSSTAVLDRNPRALGELRFEDTQGQETSIGDFLLDTHTDGFIVLHRGTVVFERYENGLLPHTPHILFSVSKSLTAILAGILADKGLLDPGSTIAHYIPEVTDSAYSGATVRHLLDMTVGVLFDEDYENETGDFARYRMATGWLPRTDENAPTGLRAFLPTLRPDGAHGTAFHYVSPNTDLLGWVLERAGGLPFAELFSKEIWQPLGAEFDAYVNVDPLGAPRTAGGICITLRDFARFGQMCLDSGLSSGRRVAPAWWIRDLQENGDQAAWDAGNFAEFMPGWRYRSQWYVSEAGAFGGLGVFGQFLYLDPATNVVIARFSSRPRALDPADKDSSYRAFESICRSLGS